MVKCTEKEGIGLLGGGMPSALTAGKHVPLSKSLYKYGHYDLDTKGTTKHRRFT